MGLGYVGLPLAVEFAKAGFAVTGIDSNSQRAASVRGGRSHILDVPSATLATLTASGRLTATANYEVVPD
ncbi:MAG: UDP-N-acetyl-D-glucosamine dehydrogenase, partial [Chloroflexota bacterium]